jgi:hypothetical protein
VSKDKMKFYILLFCIIILVAFVALVLWYRSRNTTKAIKNSELLIEPAVVPIPVAQVTAPAPAPVPIPKVFAINDGGYLDLADATGKILDRTYSPNPKIYINLLDLASKDVEAQEEDNTIKQFLSKVGDTKVYDIGGRKFMIDYTRLLSVA